MSVFAESMLGDFRARRSLATFVFAGEDQFLNVLRGCRRHTLCHHVFADTPSSTKRSMIASSVS